MRDRHAWYRWWLKAPVFTWLYGRVIGPASARMFGDLLERELLAPLPRGARVLEVGGGPGLQAVDLARRRADLEITVSDFSPSFVARARANTRGVSSVRNVVVADAMDLSGFAPASFDAVFSVTAIKHFPDPVRGLRECLRVLKPRGRLVVAEICRESDVAEIENLTQLFAVPAALKPLLTRLVYRGLREDCPPLTEVGGWLRQVGGGEARRLPGYPVWYASLTCPPAGLEPTPSESR